MSVSLCLERSEHEDLVSINNSEEGPLAFFGHHPVPAKSTTEAAEAAGDLPTQVGLSPRPPGPCPAANRDTAQWRTNHLAQDVIVQ